MTVRFVYLGPPDEPKCAGVTNALTGVWVTGEPRDIEDPSHIAWLARHPHWAAMEGEAFVDPPGTFEEAPPAEQPKRRGRPPKAR
jgi:hypothetical protein